MENVFKRLILNEFGKKAYYKFFLLCKIYIENKYIKGESSQNLNSWLLPIYIDIYEQIKDEKPETVEKMRLRLKHAIDLGIRIKKNFIYAFLFYLGGVFLILVQKINPLISLISISAMTLCFLYKVMEYFVNKYCLIDIQIIMVYKLVLDTMETIENIR